MTENGRHNGTSAYDIALTTWLAISGEDCRDPHSEVGHFVQGLMAGMVEWGSGYDSERADGIVRAARAGAAVLHGIEMVQRRELL